MASEPWHSVSAAVRAMTERASRRELALRIGKLVALLTLPPLSLAAGMVAVRSYLAEASGLVGQRRAVATPTGDPALRDLERATLVGKAHAALAAWYLPSMNGAAIVLCHGSMADRSALLPEARLLHARGFGVLLLDWPGHGESEGEIRWSVAERDALSRAVDYLAARPEVSASRIGAVGFSMGGFVVAMQAASDPRLRAVVLAGTPTGVVEHTKWEYRRWGWLSQLAALLALSRAGVPLEGAMPLTQVAGIAPRAVLVVAGAEDEVVPPHMSRQLYDAAGQPKQLLLVEGAGHGDYVSPAGSTYEATLISFFERHLGAR